MKENSLIAYNNILRTGRMRRSQLDIVAAIRKIGKPVSMHGIAEFLNVSLNSISGRFGELETAGIIKVVGKEYVNGRPRSLYYLVKAEIVQHC